MIHYVLGFMFDPTFKQVVLIKKITPVWMLGLFNGVGGKIEPGELPLTAMIREFTEETGLVHFYWNLSHEEGNNNYHMYIYSAVSVNTYSVRTMTEEEVSIHTIDDLPINLCPNIMFHIETIRNHKMKE
jgi:8-oxo-dGTP diphosphatase